MEGNKNKGNEKNMKFRITDTGVPVLAPSLLTKVNLGMLISYL